MCRRPAARAANGQRVDFAVTAGDDVGVEKVSFNAMTGEARDAAKRAAAPPVLQRSDTFGFIVPANALPGSSIAVQGRRSTPKARRPAPPSPPSSARRDCAGDHGDRRLVRRQVAGAADHDRGVRGGRGRHHVDHAESGRRDGAEPDQAIDPPRNSIVTTFTVMVPASAQPPQSLTIDASAEDRAGNVGNAPRAILPVADKNAPVVTSLRTSTGALQAVPGRT